MKFPRMRGASLLILGAWWACSGAWAQSASAAPSVSLYGLVDGFAGSVRRSDQAARTPVVGSGGLTTSYWGLAGQEDLGGGLRATFALESFFQVDTGIPGRTVADPFLSRNAYVGLVGNFGQITIGRQTNPLFVVTGSFNPFGTSLNFSPVMLQTWSPLYNRNVLGDSVWDNALQYTTPTWAGLRANIIYSLGEIVGAAGRHNANLTVNYEHKPFSAAVSVQHAGVGPGIAAPALRNDTALVAVAYDFGFLKLMAEGYRTRTPDTSTKTSTAELGLTVPTGPSGRVLASIASTRRTAAAVDTRRTGTSVGYDHDLSKRTDVYAVVMQDKLTRFSSTTSFALGVRHRF